MGDQFESSILVTIKKMLGLELDYCPFDVDVITHINAAMMTLQQLGVGPEHGMFITGISEKWDDFFSSASMLEAAKTYIYIFVRLIFDPPTNAFVTSSLEKTKDMLEWRLKEQAAHYNKEKGEYNKAEPVKEHSGSLIGSGFNSEEYCEQLVMEGVFTNGGGCL